MTEYKCASCLNKVETFDKNDGIVIVYGCRHCENSNRLDAVATEGCKISVEEKIIRHNLNAVDVICKAMNRER